MILRHPIPTLSPADGLEELLLAPSRVPEQLDLNLRRVLANRLAAKAPARHRGSLRLDSYTILNAHSEQGVFTWSPRRARRLLGAAAASAVLEGRSPHPLAAVHSEVDDVIARATQEHTRPGSLGTWLGEAPRGVQAAAIAEASAWATELLISLSPHLLHAAPLVGRADPVWAVPGAPWISLRARRDLEVNLESNPKTRALLCVRNGRPNSQAPEDLSLVGLIDALTHPGVPLPTRVVGLWPAAGRAFSLEIDPDVMRSAARRVVEAIERRRQVSAAAA